jgi:hypothetical protein
MNIMAWLLCRITTSRPFGGRIYSNGLIVICWVGNDAYQHFQRDTIAASSRKNAPTIIQQSLVDGSPQNRLQFVVQRIVLIHRQYAP